MSDGEIIIDASINTEEFKKKLEELIKETERRVTELRRALLNAKLEAGILGDMFARNNAPENVKALARELEKVQTLLSSLRTKYSSLLPKPDVKPIREFSEAIQQVPTSNISLISEKIKEINRSSRETNDIWKQMPTLGTSIQNSLNNISDSFSKLYNRMMAIIRNAVLFSILSRSMRQLVTDIGVLINRDSQLSRSLAILKANLINAFTPIVRVILPWIRAFANGLVWLSQNIVRFINSLTGANMQIVTTQEKAKIINDNFYSLTHNVGSSAKALDDIKKSIGSSGDSIGKVTKNTKTLGNSIPKTNKNLNKLLASFDKLEVISFEDKGFEEKFKDQDIADSLKLDSFKPEKLIDDIKDVKAEIKDTPFDSIAGKEIEMPKIGFEVDPESQKAVDQFIGWSQKIFEWLEKNKWATDILLASFAGLIAFFEAKKFAKILGLAFSNPVLLIIGAVIAGIVLLLLNWDKVDAFLKKKRKWLGGLSILDILQGIWDLIVIVIDGIVELIKAIVEGSTKIYKALEKAFTFAVDLVKKLWNGLKDFVKLLAGDVQKGFNDFWENIKKVGKNFSDVFKGIKDGLHDFADNMKKKAEEFKNKMSDAWAKGKEYAKSFAEESIKKINNVKDKTGEIGKGFGNVWEKAKKVTSEWLHNIWEDISSWFRTLWVEGKKWISDGMGKWWDVISNWFNDLWKGLKDWFKNTFGKILKGIEDIKKGVNPDFGGNDFEGKIPKLAQGAVLRGGDPFLAYLNDQPRGQTNIEAPLNTIVDAFKQATGSNSGSQNIVITATGDMAQFIRMLNLKIVDEQSRVGTSMINTTIGGGF